LIKAGDKKALAVVYERYVNVLYNYAVKICKDPDLIEDSIQDLFIDIWRYRKNLSDTDSVKYYLYFSLRTKIARHSSVTSRLINEGIRWDDIKGLVSGSSEEDFIESEHVDERARRIQKFLHNLSPRQYEAIVLRFYDEFSFDDIGKIMDMNPQSVRNLIQRGLVQLKQYTQLLTSFLLFFLI
jgi:RNA polymerase sigma-70 factor (ECF subfamily)